MQNKLREKNMNYIKSITKGQVEVVHFQPSMVSLVFLLYFMRALLAIYISWAYIILDHAFFLDKSQPQVLLVDTLYVHEEGSSSDICKHS